MNTVIIASLLTDLFTPILTAVGAALATVIAGLAVKLLHKFLKKVGLDTDEAAERATERAIERAVLQVQQVFVSRMRKAANGGVGNLTAEDAKEAFSLALKESRIQLKELSDKNNPLAKKLLADADALGSRIESMVPLVKKKLSI